MVLVNSVIMSVDYISLPIAFYYKRRSKLKIKYEPCNFFVVLEVILKSKRKLREFA